MDQKKGIGLAGGCAIATVLAVFVGVVGFVLLIGGTSKKEDQGICSPTGGPAVSVQVSNLPVVDGYTPAQVEYAAIIAHVAQENGFDRRAQLIGLMTAMQESTLGTGITNGIAWNEPNTDGDAGLFQQRQQPGWYGSLEMVNDPAYAAAAFYNGVTAKSDGDWGSVGGGGGYGHLPGLVDVDGWESMSLTRAAQAVQRSRYPDAYAKHEAEASRLLDALSGVQVAPASDGGAGAVAGTCQVAGGTVTLDGLPTQAQLEAPDVNVACPDGTTDLGIHTGGVNGKKVPVRLCSVAGTVCTGSDCRKGELSGLARGEVIVNAMIAPQFIGWLNAIRAAGQDPTFNSSYRSWETQSSFTGGNVARPGWSNHQMGYAVDISGLPGSYNRHNCQGFAPDGSCKAFGTAWETYHSAGLDNGALFHNEEFWHLEWLITDAKDRDVPFIQK